MVELAFPSDVGERVATVAVSFCCEAEEQNMKESNCNTNSAWPEKEAYIFTQLPLQMIIWAIEIVKCIANNMFLAPKVLLDYLRPMITIQSHPFHPIPQSLFNHLNRPWIGLRRPPMISNDYQ